MPSTRKNGFKQISQLDLQRLYDWMVYKFVSGQASGRSTGHTNFHKTQIKWLLLMRGENRSMRKKTLGAQQRRNKRDRFCYEDLELWSKRQHLQIIRRLVIQYHVCNGFRCPVQFNYAGSEKLPYTPTTRRQKQQQSYSLSLDLDRGIQLTSKRFSVRKILFVYYHRSCLNIAIVEWSQYIYFKQ